MNEKSHKAGFSEAYKAALNIVAYRDNTAKKLRDKLKMRGFDSETVEAVLEKLRFDGYLNEERMIINAAHHLATVKLYGKRRIRSELYGRGFDRQLIDSLDFECSELEEIDFYENCAKLLQKRGGNYDPKTVAYLQRYGYSVQEIKYAYKCMGEARSEE